MGGWRGLEVNRAVNSLCLNQKTASHQAGQGRSALPDCILSKKVDYRELGVWVEGGKVSQDEVKVRTHKWFPENGILGPPYPLGPGTRCSQVCTNAARGQLG